MVASGTVCGCRSRLPAPNFAWYWRSICVLLLVTRPMRQHCCWFSASNGRRVFALSPCLMRRCLSSVSSLNWYFYATVGHDCLRLRLLSLWPTPVPVCWGFRSLSPSKLDDLLDEMRDRSLDVPLLCETWHDADSVSVRRLRYDGYCVIERARPRTIN